MKKIAYITWGCGSQIISFRDYAHYMDDMIYIHDLPSYDLTQYAAVIIADHTHADQIAEHADQINAYVESGGFLIAFPVSNIDKWLTVVDVKWENKSIADWLWWTKPDGEIEIYNSNPEHSLYDYVTIDDMKWHWHGVFANGHNGDSLVNTYDNDSLMVDFKNLPNGGRVLLTTLDPHSHNGQRFMPAAMRLVAGFYPWLNSELGIDRNKLETFEVTYLSSSSLENENKPPLLVESFKDIDANLKFESVYETNDDTWQSDIIIIPRICDQFYLRTLEREFLDYLANGGQLIINTETVISWLPMLKPFKTIPSQPWTNLKVTVNNDPYGFFNNMPDDFDAWEGIIGQYSRGYSEMPVGAIQLTNIGLEGDKKPADWLWQYPTDDGRGGKIVVHNGDDYHRYPDHGPNKSCLVRDICLGLIKNKKHCIVDV